MLTNCFKGTKDNKICKKIEKINVGVLEKSRSFILFHFIDYTDGTFDVLVKKKVSMTPRITLEKVVDESTRRIARRILK